MQHMTRRELYDLVWSKPATHIAKELGVSDVWVGKVCKKANIPKPSPGYWQKIAAEKIMRRVALPQSLALQPSDMFVLGDDGYGRFIRKSIWEAPKSDEEPLPPLPEPPAFLESMDDVLRNAEALTASLKFSETLLRPHPMTIKFLTIDEKRAQKEGPFYLRRDKPKFRHPAGKELLTALNRLFAAWSLLGAEVHLDGQKAPHISIFILGQVLPLSVIDYGWEGNEFVRPKRSKNWKYGFFWEHHYENDRFSTREIKSYREYEGFPPNILRAIVVESIMSAEENMRESAQYSYECAVKHRAEAEREREQRRLAAIRRHEEQLQRQREKRIDLTNTAIDSIFRSDQLRSLIAAFDEKLSTNKESVLGYEKWHRWASQHANELDPRNMSVEHIEQWIQKFHLHE